MLAVGGVAFATAPWLGRTRAMAFGLIVLFASYLIYSYASLSPVIDSLKPLSFFRWTEGHRPMAGVSDWPSVGGAGRHHDRAVRDRRRRVRPTRSRGRGQRRVAAAAVAAGRHRADRSPDSSPTGRAIAIAWGLGIGLYGILIVASAEAFSDMITNLPQIAALIETIYPGLDLTQPSAVLQLTFFGFGSFIIGLAGCHVPGRLGRRRRPAPARGRPVDAAVAGLWAVRSGLGVMGAIGVVTPCIAAAHRDRGRVPGWRRRRPPVVGRRRPGPGGCRVHRGRSGGRGLVRSSLAAGVTGVLVDRDAAARYAGRGAQAARVGPRPVDLQAPRPTDGRQLRPGRDRRGRDHGGRWRGGLRVWASRGAISAGNVRGWNPGSSRSSSCRPCCTWPGTSGSRRPATRSGPRRSGCSRRRSASCRSGSSVWWAQGPVRSRSRDRAGGRVRGRGGGLFHPAVGRLPTR